MATYRKCALRSQAAWDAMTTVEQDEYDAHYLTIGAWSLAEGTDLVTNSMGDSILECFNDWPAGASWDFTDDYTHGWTTDETNCRIIRAATGHGHGGVVGSGFFILSPAGNGPRLRTKTRLQGITIKGTDYTSVLFYAPGGLLFLDRCIFHHFKTTYFLGETGNIANNCIFYDYTDYIISGNSTGDYITYNRCLFYKVTGNVIDNRCVRYAAVYGCIAWISGDFAGTYDLFYQCVGNGNIAKDNSAPSTPPTVAELGWTDEANGDFSITKDSVLCNTGIEISGSTEDIIGTPRPQGISNDIGPFEVIELTPIELKGVVVGSRVGIINMDSGTDLVTPFEALTTDISLEIPLSGETNISVRIRKYGTTKYLPYRSDFLLTSSGVTLYVSQTQDLVAS